MKLYANGLYRGKAVDVLVDGPKILDVGPPGMVAEGSPPVLLDLGGMEIFPLMIDVHAHLRDPGQEYKEGLESGLRGALLNGISHVAVMSNTSPVLDSPERVEDLEMRALSYSNAALLVNAAATLGQNGRTPAPFHRYPRCVRAVSDDGRTIADENVLRDVFTRAAKAGLVVMSHCEDQARRGFMEDTERTRELGIPTVTESDEAVIVDRNIRMAAETGCRLHICHISSVDGLNHVMEAKESGLPVTCEVTPHHIFLSVDNIDYDDGFFKVNPPLRSEATRQHLLSALVKGNIDMIATDHAPHAMHEKRISVESACFGFSGFDSLFPNLYTHLLKPGLMSREELYNGYLWMYRSFYSMANILRRLPDDRGNWLPYLLFNLGYRKFGKVTSLVARLGLMQSVGALARRLSYGIA